MPGDGRAAGAQAVETGVQEGWRVLVMFCCIKIYSRTKIYDLTQCVRDRKQTGQLALAQGLL